MNIELDGKVYELPKFTMKIAKMQLDVENAERTSDLIYKKAYEFVKTIIEKAELDVILEGKSIDDIDLVKLNSIYTLIVTVYRDALENPKLEANQNRIDKMSGTVDMVTKVANAANQLGIK